MALSDCQQIKAHLFLISIQLVEFAVQLSVDVIFNWKHCSRSSKIYNYVWDEASVPFLGCPWSVYWVKRRQSAVEYFITQVSV